MHGSSGIIKNFCTNRVIGLLILPLVCTGSHREFPSHGRFFTDGRFPSCMFCQTRVILFMGNVHDLTHSVFYVVHDCGCIPYPSRGRKRLAPTPWAGWSGCIPYPSRGRKLFFLMLYYHTGMDASPTPHGDGNALRSKFICFPDGDASPTPHGDGNERHDVGAEGHARCIPYPSRGRKPIAPTPFAIIIWDASPTPHGDGNIHVVRDNHIPN